jgi:adenosine deaminase
MTQVTRELLHRLPKAELHVHLDGSLRPETMLELAADYGKRMPAHDPDALRDYMHVQDARNLVEYLERFDITLSVMQTADALERIAYELAEDLAAENVRYAEIRYSPILNTRDGLPLTEAVDAPLRGLKRAEEDFGIQTRIIICGIRNMEPATSRDLADLTVAYKDRGVVAFDLAGAEYNYPAKKHKDAFYTVINKNMAATIHAGEAYGAESIHQALHYCRANRIGHGTRLYEDPDLMRFMNDFRIPSRSASPPTCRRARWSASSSTRVRQYYDAGWCSSLNTDNRLMSATTVTEEYWRAHEHLGFTWEELVDINLMAFEASFLHRTEKLALMERIREETASLTAEAA